jgi:AcrR family transcriptional regulator
LSLSFFRDTVRPMSAPAQSIAPQQARSRATRHNLLAATVECLIEDGYAGTTTTEVCRRAGVSQGALFKHFRTKAALLAATVEHLFALLIDDYRRDFSVAAEADDRVGNAVRLLWKTFQRPSLHAAYDLMVAGRTDAELRAALEPVQIEHGRNLRQAALELFPEAADGDLEAFETAIDVIVSAMQGAALGALTQPDPGVARRLAFLEALARRVLEKSDKWT